MNPRTHTPDCVTLTDDGHESIRFTLKRACNGCGNLLGDLDDRDLDGNGHTTDVRGECPNCEELVRLERIGCRTWHVTLRSITQVDNDIDKLGVFAKGYRQEVDGKLQAVGLRVGDGYADRVVALYGDWLVYHPDGHFSVHKAPAT
ncbi:hypothetical protein [Streptomyces sp. NPDC058657]|uniref:hypothetical protein n=1 Tax=unclassified Streptomyces TaxID=2593676 RepID=UPI0036682AC1